MTLCNRAGVIEFARITGVLTPGQQVIIDDMCAAATKVIEDDPVCGVGPVELGTRMFEFGATPGALDLAIRFTSVLSVTVDGVVLDPNRYLPRGKSGLLDPRPRWAVPPWVSAETVAVAVTVGAAAVPANVKQAALELVSFWWQQTQQAQRWAWQEGTVPQGFAIPSRVKELLASSPSLPGFG